MAIRIGIVGLGKIALDQHVPSIGRSPEFELVAACSPQGDAPPGLATIHRSVEAMLEATPGLDAVAVCTPPGPRHAVARAALLAGKHVLLEKPPAATVSELQDLEALAAAQGRVLFTAWHSQHNAAVAEAARLLRGETVTALDVEWREDVRVWHPGQDWVWRPGGFGVFNPGINALSIVVAILPQPIFVTSAELSVPANADAPVAARMVFASATGGAAGASLRAVFDWRPTPSETWEIGVETASGHAFHLSGGGRRLHRDGALVMEGSGDEYGRVYARFAALLRDGRSDVDARPLLLAADAFLIGTRVLVGAVER